jgi:hypothetical protein
MTMYAQTHHAPIDTSHPVGAFFAWLRNTAAIIGSIIEKRRVKDDLDAVESEFGRQDLKRIPLRPFDQESESLRLYLR